jgi:hypothetical protein
VGLPLRLIAIAPTARKNDAFSTRNTSTTNDQTLLSLDLLNLRGSLGQSLGFVYSTTILGALAFRGVRGESYTSSSHEFRDTDFDIVYRRASPTMRCRYVFIDRKVEILFPPAKEK